MIKLLFKTRVHRFCSSQNPKIPGIEKPAKSEDVEQGFQKLASHFGSKDVGQFSNRKLYENLFEFPILMSRIKLSGIYGAFWLGTAGLTYAFVNPWVAFIPVWLSFTTSASCVQGSRYMKHLVKSVTIHEDLKKCDILVAEGSVLTVDIQNNEILKLLDVVPDVKDSEDVTDKYRQTNYVLLISVKEIKSEKVFDQLRLLISPDQVFIENTELLRQVLDGEDVTNWKFVSEVSAEDKQKPQFDFNIDQFEKDLEEQMEKEQQTQKSEENKSK